MIYHAGRDVEPLDLGLPSSLRPSLFRFAPARGHAVPHTDLRLSCRRAVSAIDDLAVEATFEAAAPISGSGPYDFRAADVLRPRIDVDAIAPGALNLELPEGGTTFDDLEREILDSSAGTARTTTSPARRAASA